LTRGEGRLEREGRERRGKRGRKWDAGSGMRGPHAGS